MKKALGPLGITGLVLVLDQVSKWLVSSRCTLYDTKVLIPHVLEFFYLHNDGAAMGFFSGARWLLMILTGLLVVGCLVYLLSGRCRHTLMQYALGLIVGGGIGNWIDRLVYGYVIDFVRFPVSWFSYSFNIADCAVCIGAGLLILDLLVDMLRSSSKQSPRE